MKKIFNTIKRLFHNNDTTFYYQHIDGGFRLDIDKLILSGRMDRQFKAARELRTRLKINK